MRQELEYLGQYRATSKGKQVLSRLGRNTTAVVDWHAFRWLEGVPGVELILERDNKSVWSPDWIGKALKKYTSAETVPAALEQRLEALAAKQQFRGSANDARLASAAAEITGERCGARSTGQDGSPAASAVGTVSSPVATGGRSSAAAGSHGAAFKAFGGVSPSGDTGSGLSRSSANLTLRRRVVLADRGAGSCPKFERAKASANAYDRAKAATLAAAGGRGRRRELLSLDAVAREHVHLAHFAGAPFFTSNDDALERALVFAESIDSGRRAMDPYVAGRRIQHGPLGPKGRLVWMAPLATTLLATRFSKPAYWGMVGREGFAYGRRNMEIGVFLSALQARHEHVYALDFSAFDASLPAWLIADAFDILATHLQMDAGEESLYNRLVNDFIHSRIVLPDQSIWQVHRGVPSGSAFTSLIDSICNYLIIQYVWIRVTGRGVKPHDMMVLGDDSVVGSNVFINMSTIARVAKELGVNLSSEKSERASSGHMVPFLGHNWKNSRAHRSRQDLAIRMAFPERHRRRSRADSGVRVYSYIADAEEAIDLYLDMFKSDSRDIYERVRQGLGSTGGQMSETAVRDGPGRLSYLSNVENDTEVKAMIASGIKLAIVGAWKT